MTRITRPLTSIAALAALAAFFPVAPLRAQGTPKDLDIRYIIDVGPVDIGSCTCVRKPFELPRFRIDHRWGHGPTPPLTPAPLGDLERVALLGNVAELREDQVLQRAIEGDGFASFQIAMTIAAGVGIKLDERNALAWFLRAAYQNNHDAPAVVAYRLFHGIGVERDPVSAAFWFRYGATLGDPKSFIALGLLYATGQGVPQDFPRAVALWEQAGDNTISQRLVADAYACGVGVPWDLERAAAIYRRLLNGLGLDYSGVRAQFARMAAEGCGVERDEVEAIKLFEAESDSGDPEAQVDLGEMLLNGAGGEQRPYEAYVWASYAALRLPGGALRDRALKLQRAAGARLDGYTRRVAGELIAATMAQGRSFRQSLSAAPDK